MATFKSSARAYSAALAKSPASTPADPGRFVAGRMGFGCATAPPPPSAKATFDADAWFDEQVRQASVYGAYGGVAGLLDTYPTLALDPWAVRGWLNANFNNEWLLTATAHLEQATLLLQAFSPAQLFEASVDFFSNVLNVANLMPLTWCSRPDYDRTVIRANAFGKYRDMLLASAKHPAMLEYLDNTRSVATGINENYGREILECHTVGSAGGYTQNDVVNSARILTGRQITWQTLYVWNRTAHWTGAVQVIGFSDPNSDAAAGEALGDRYLSYLASLPATARNLAKRMCLRFVSDTPSTALVKAVADAYLGNDTAILPMLRTILHSDEFWASSGAKLRRPTENLAATLQAVGAQPGSDLAAAGAALSAAAVKVGQRPLAWGAPNGYPDVAGPWLTAGTLVEQWRFQLNLLSGSLAPAIVAPTATSLVSGSTGSSTSDAINELGVALLGRALSGAEVAALTTYLGVSSNAPATPVVTGDAATVGAILLHSPAHTFR